MKIKEWIKRPVNINFISVLIVAFILFIFAAVCYLQGYLSDKELESLGIEICSACNKYYIYKYVKIPIFNSLVIIFMSVLLRIIYFAKSQKRLLVYRIMTGICYIFMFVSCLFCSSILYIVITLIPIIIFDLLVISVTVMGIRNTYSDRILK